MITVKLKNLFERKKIQKRWAGQLVKKANEIYAKKDEIIKQYLIAGRSRNDPQIQFYRGQLEILEWLTGEKFT